MTRRPRWLTAAANRRARTKDPHSHQTSRQTLTAERRDRMRQAAHLLLPAIAYGDAAGAPFEGEPPRRQRQRKLTPYRDGMFGPSAAGSWTDDTQLSVALTRALIGASGFNLKRIAHEHAAQLAVTPKKALGTTILVRGWGASTTAAVDQYRRGTPPHRTGSPGGAGNGVLMKMAPLAWWHAAHGTGEEQALKEWDALTTFTHDSDVARVCTRVHGTVLRHLLENTHTSPTELMDRALSAAHHHEELLGAPPHTSEELEALTQLTPGACEKRLRKLVCRASRHSDKLYGFYAPETLAVVYGAYLQWGASDRLAEIIYGAISLGGDCDSTGSMIGALAVCAAGGELEPPEDLDVVAQIDDLHTLSQQLAVAGLPT
ncbi:ADP-ribosylglycohydrolase family protein [Mycobacteroides abscessus]|uniref:ADP-ribosylglycohydrolase family protein n=1 Tax=Mycobacteroides abscessus TaxID=36809 RepID=UPI00130007FB|nr:ADP-ribosylglycohydrolase family protein [Mycobacteroides abscessus]